MNELDQKIESIRNHIHNDYFKKTQKSNKLYKKLKDIMPGGVSGSFRYFAPYPFYIKSSLKTEIVDIDNNKYLDCFSGNGPLLLGHNNPKLERELVKNKNYGLLPLNPDLLYEAASLINELVPCAESTRFVNTGTEAVMSAVRIARAYTGKSKIVKFHGHYHGQHDEFLIAIDKTKDLFSHGVPISNTDKIIVEPFNNISRLEKLFKKEHDIAAVIMDASMHAGGLWGTTKKYLKELRYLTKKYNIILIFDEVITGFRLSSGGAQKYFNIKPDLCTLAKAMGAGEKIAAVSGKKKIMNILDPSIDNDTYVFQSGTVNDGANALSSMIAALKVYKSLEKNNKYSELNNKAIKLKKELINAFGEVNIPCKINQVGSMLQIYISPKKLNFFNLDKRFNSIIELFYLALINQNILLSLPTSNHIYLSFIHTDKDLSKIIRTTKYVLNHYNFHELNLNKQLK